MLLRLLTNRKKTVSVTDVTMYISDPGPEVIKLFSCSTKLSMKCIMLIHVKMSSIIGIYDIVGIYQHDSYNL